MICPNCHKETMDKAKFCMQCGSRILEEETPDPIKKEPQPVSGPEVAAWSHESHPNQLEIPPKTADRQGVEVKEKKLMGCPGLGCIAIAGMVIGILLASLISEAIAFMATVFIVIGCLAGLLSIVMLVSEYVKVCRKYKQPILVGISLVWKQLKVEEKQLFYGGIIIILFAFGIFTGAGATMNARVKSQQEIKQVQEYFHAGVDLLKQGYYDKALDKFEFVRSKDPKFKGLEGKIKEAENGKAKEAYERAVKLAQKNNLIDAFDLLEEAARLDPTSETIKDKLSEVGGKVVQDLYDKGIAAFKGGNAEASRKFFEKILAFDQGYKDAKYQFSLTFGLTKDYETAITNLESIPSNHPSYEKAHAKINEYEDLIRRRDAQRRYEEEQRKNKSLQELYDKGMAAFKGNDALTARANFDNIMDIDPLFKDTQYYQALTYGLSQDFELAISHLEEISRDLPFYKKAQAKIVEYRKLIRKREAQSQYEEAQRKQATEKRFKQESEAGPSFSLVERNPVRYLGQKVAWKGSVLQITEENNNTYFQVSPEGGSFGASFIVIWNGYLDEAIKSGTTVKVYGIITGQIEGKNLFGGDIAPIVIESTYLTYWH